MEFKFKKTLFGGQVLMVKDKRAIEPPGAWKYYWRKATTEEAYQFTIDIELLREKIPLIKKLKDEHPSIFI